MLKTRGLNTFYGNIQALKDISIHVPPKRVISIIGANGAGKSTLLKSISGLNTIQSGKILYKDKDIAGAAVNRIVGMGITQVPEGRQVFSRLTVQDNIHLGAYLYHKRRYRKETDERMEFVYELFPILKNRSKQIAGTLSGGEQQMLAIGRALMGRPELLLLDEPSMGLAPLVVKEIFAVIKRMNRSGTTILLVEQNAKAALNVADYAFVLETGKIVLEGQARDLLDNPRVKAAYLGG